MVNSQQNLDQGGFLNLLKRSEFYEYLSEEEKQRLILIILSCDEPLKADLLNLIYAVKADFEHLRSKFLKKETENLNKQTKILKAIDNDYKKGKRQKEEGREKQEEEKVAEDLLEEI